MSRVFANNREEEARLKGTAKGAYTHQILTRMDKLSNLPARAWGDLTVQVPTKDFDKYVICKDYQLDVVNQVNQGKGLYIYGNAGNGKTTWGYKIARKLMATLAYNHIDKGLVVYFANVPELMNELKLGFNDSELQRRLNYSIENADLVIFDDIGAENSTDWAKEQLYHYINYRYSNNKATIFTSNFPPTALEMRVADRVRGMTTIVHFESGSQRHLEQNNT